jgi:hypothetical protein
MRKITQLWGPFQDEGAPEPSFDYLYYEAHYLEEWLARWLDEAAKSW